MSRTIKIGDTGSDVSAWHATLRGLGYEPGPDTGEFTSDMDRDTRRFQTARNIKVDGEVGPQTRAAAQVHALPVGPVQLAGVPPKPGHLLGIDVSAFQGAIDWATLPGNVRYAYIRTTHGAAVDSRWERNADGCVLPWGPYHGMAYGSDPVEQAKAFAAALRGRGDFAPVLDFEVCRPGERASEAVQRGVVCMREIEQRVGRRCVVYTYPAFLQRLIELGADLSEFGKRPLWIAHYATGRKTALLQPQVPTAWSTWHLWQVAGNGYARLPNGSDVDVNWFRGSEEELAAFCCYNE
jgi:GH25 family lysozyme M1 (1,4-beta-N-acetylmuramidase)